MNKFASVLTLAGYAAAYDQSLTSCNEFAALFPSTNGVYSCATATGDNAGTPMSGSWLTDTSAGTTFTCTNGSNGSDSYCWGADTSNGETESCSHNFKLCVTCSQTNGVTYIQYQTMMSPNRCWQTTQLRNSPEYGQVDFKVTWNQDMTGMSTYTADQIDTASEATDILCDLQRTADSNIGHGISYTDGTDAKSIKTASGGGINGVMLYNGLAGGDVDAVMTEVDTMDLCLEHSSPNGDFHHHSIGPCDAPGSSLFSTTEKPGRCGEGTTCLDNGYMYSQWPTSNYGGVWGLAKDGHIIYGPYNGDGELWSCTDIDFCNGFTDSSGSYAYASTTFFPYMVGCWGPAPAYTIGVYESCSSNGCYTGAVGLQIGIATLVALSVAMTQ